MRETFEICDHCELRFNVTSGDTKIQRIGLGWERYDNMWMGDGGAPQPHHFEGIDLGEMCNKCKQLVESLVRSWMTQSQLDNNEKRNNNVK